MKIIGVVPARYGATRLPGKPLVSIAGKTLVQRVVEQCQRAKRLDKIIVATDDTRVMDAVHDLCCVEMTSIDHASGTDRIAEVAARHPCDGVINIQGDEPLMDPAIIDSVAEALHRAPMTTAATPLLNPEEYQSPNIVKVVVDAEGRALYFSRSTIPFLREAGQRPIAEQLTIHPFLKHLGIYGYHRDVLLRLVRWPVSSLENAEKLEQLRALENGIPIVVVNVEYQGVSVDVPEDVRKVEVLLARKSRKQRDLSARE